MSTLSASKAILNKSSRSHRYRQNPKITKSNFCFSNGRLSAVPFIALTARLTAHSTALVVQLYAIASGGGNAAIGNQIVKDLSIPAGDTYIFDVERLLLDNGDTLNANTTVAAKVTATVSQTSI